MVAREVPENVWSAVRLQGKSEEAIDRSAQMYSAFLWRADSPGHDEFRCVPFLINGTVMEDHLREQVASTPLGTVLSSWLSSADRCQQLSFRVLKPLAALGIPKR